jgi:multiple sugar transport system substrate-binding protein
LRAEERPRLAGFVFPGRQSEGLVCAALETIRAFGGEVFDARGRVALDTPEAVRGAEFLRGLVASGMSPPLVTSADEETARRLFQAGDALFMRNWPYCGPLLESPGSPVRGAVAFGPLPAGPGGPGGGTLGGWQLAVNRLTPAWKRDAAWALVEWLSSPEVERRVLRAYGLLPPRPALYRDPAFRAAEPFAAAIEPALAGARPRPVTPYWLMVSEELQPGLSAAIAGIRAPREALARAAVEVEHILGEARR